MITTRNERYMLQAYLLMLRRTLELIDDTNMIRLEQDRKWRFYRDMAIKYKCKHEAENLPN